MVLTKLFESLDEKVFTEETKLALTESFEAAVTEASEAKALEIADAKIEERTSELEEKAEEFHTLLQEESAEKEAQLLDQVDAYLEKVVEDFITEASDKLDESIKVEKSDMIIEAMDAMLVATGADIARITEAKEVLDESGAVSLQAELDKSSEKVDALVEENIALEKRGAELLKMGVIAELKEGMSTLEAEKFSKLANLVEFEDSSVYLEKLGTIKESIGTKKPEEKIEEKFEKIEEKKEEKTSLSTSFSHLI